MISATTTSADPTGKYSNDDIHSQQYRYASMLLQKQRDALQFFTKQRAAIINSSDENNDNRYSIHINTLLLIVIVLVVPVSICHYCYPQMKVLTASVIILSS